MAVPDTNPGRILCVCEEQGRGELEGVSIRRHGIRQDRPLYFATGAEEEPARLRGRRLPAPPRQVRAHLRGEIQAGERCTFSRSTITVLVRHSAALLGEPRAHVSAHLEVIGRKQDRLAAPEQRRGVQQRLRPGEVFPEQRRASFFEDRDVRCLADPAQRTAALE